MRKSLFLLALFLSACTGSQEPPLPALVAAGGGDAVRFYRAADLQSGGSTPVETWSAPTLQDLAYSNAFQRLFLLFPDRLEAYSTAGFTESAAPQGSPTTALLGVDCTGGYLRLGANQALVHCPNARRAFLFPLPDLGSPTEADLTGLPSGVRLALFPQGGVDLLAYLAENALGYRPATDPTGTPSQEVSLPSLTPTELRLDPGGRLLGAGYTTTDTLFLAWNGAQNPSSQSLGLYVGPVRLALDPAQGLVAFGGGFRVLAPRDSGARNTYAAYTAATVGQDGYLYLARGGVLEVYDLQQNPLPSYPQASPSLGFSPQALAFIPVE
ncbi:hypothetical protein QT17_06375 [Thermus sp. 2.9]|uniref:hypothetical protein n=1 Tax=Thermus sp. (strain 2.9) TaxID=1577051 RepID=UPI00054235C7|nr:hypothetical protein [Thermus sp. 2.9]KHG65473.1 hypothetical protein QT17_06375 [Thermus sp. 2.9]